MKARLVREADSDEGRFPNGKHAPSKRLSIGTIVEHPDAWRLVRLGIAEPADAECVARSAMNAEEMAAAQKAQDRIAAGIHPDDYDAYDRGWMAGYAPDGRGVGPHDEWTPGPKYAEYQALMDDYAEEEDE